jgi:hypothetical protein
VKEKISFNIAMVLELDILALVESGSLPGSVPRIDLLSIEFHGVDLFAALKRRDKEIIKDQIMDQLNNED